MTPTGATTITLETLRRYAVARSLFAPVTLARAVRRMGFVQADPIRAPARAQDLTLRHRVKGYRAGDLERRYASVGIEEDSFVNYGFVSAEVHALMHPRRRSPAAGPPRTRADRVLAFVRERGEVHPREVDAHFAHGRVTNYWGGSSAATTHLLDQLHYRGLLRVTRRLQGIRLYAARDGTATPGGIVPRQRVDALVDVAVNLYAPLPGATLSSLVGRLRYAVPQWRGELKTALARARARLAHASVEGLDWYWPIGERPEAAPPGDGVRLLAPFDPVVWDRRRFERFWDWSYRFEAYTPAAKRKLGYYALPMLWRDRVIGWANLSAREGRLEASIGYVTEAPRDKGFRGALDDELDRLREFLRLDGGGRM